jgi:DNA-binding IclR family transcriptional regulator
MKIVVKNAPSRIKANRRPRPITDSGFNTPSLDRALAILECLARQPAGMTLSELASVMGFSVNFVYRITQALAAHGYAVRDADKRFRLGPKLVQLCQPVHDDVPLTEAALPALRWLSNETGEASHLGILVGAEGLVLERVIGTALIKFYVERGTRFPLHTSAPGKSMLAFLPEPEQETILAQMDFKQYQPWTITSATEFRQHLEQVRQNGYATDLGEYMDGHHCLGAPILNGEGVAIASLWITGPGERLTEEKMASLVPLLKQASRMVAETMFAMAGGRP